MADLNLLRELSLEGDTRIVMLVLDGLGGLPREPGGPTELEFARTPNLDRLAAESMLGLSIPIGNGLTPGSGPGHMALFGYDPVRFLIGRGVLEALGIGFALTPADLAARGNFCTVDAEMRITDRRAGRIPTATCAELVEKLRAIRLEGVEIFVEPVQDYRFALIFRGPGLSARLNETDPQKTGVPPLPVAAQAEEARRAAEIANRWIAAAREILKAERPANMVTLRGWATEPGLPRFDEVYKLKAQALAVYPMYKGLAMLVGMNVLQGLRRLEDQLEALRANWTSYDFFFIHYKYTDSRGEDGNFEAKAAEIEKVDAVIPQILALKPDVLIVTGDHSTPAAWKAHSWHPVPTLIHAPGRSRRNAVTGFGETECLKGVLGQFPAVDLMPMALAFAGRMAKFGA
ncbi:MAG: 2,3-bisphosphoglycerate-independent phosphoglycerate mutase [Desulfobacterales bacterium]|jgi:2,3-bisphosphoglycerate-independent phosphoglycerate mutase|nr:2,3-bisphosphoglycerate-independent phosphoglycerate mutase [Desulfobacterales bacterium]